MTENNGRIKLSWAQVAWAIAVLVSVLLSWGDLRVGQARMEERQTLNTARIAAIEARLDQNSFTRQDAATLKAELEAKIENENRRIRR